MNSLIDIQGNADIHSYLVDKFSRMHWYVAPSASKDNEQYWSSILKTTVVPRFFTIDYENQSFSCFSFSNVPNEDADVITTMEDAQALMRFVEVNWKELRVPSVIKVDLNQFKDVSGSMKPSFHFTAEMYEEFKKMAQNSDTPIMTSFQKSFKEEYYSKHHVGYMPLFVTEPADKIGKQSFKDEVDEKIGKMIAKKIKTLDMTKNYINWLNDGGIGDGL